MLKLLDHSKPFEVYRGISDFIIGVLMQENHLIAYENRKFKDLEYHYSIYEKEMIIIVYYLRT